MANRIDCELYEECLYNDLLDCDLDCHREDIIERADKSGYGLSQAQKEAAFARAVGKACGEFIANLWETDGRDDKWRQEMTNSYMRKMNQLIPTNS